MSREKLFKVSAVCAGMLAGLGLLAGSKVADAAKILLDNNETKVYSVSLEGYLKSNKQVTKDSGKSIAIQIDAADFAGGALSKPYTITITLDNGYFPQGKLYYLKGEDGKVYAVANQTNNSSTLSLVNNDDIFNNSSQPIENSQFNTNGSTIAFDKKLTLVVNGTGENATVFFGNKDASCNNLPSWTISVDINGGAQGSKSVSRTFAQVKPQITISGPQTGVLNARLDAERDFKEFSGNGTKISYNGNLTSISKGSVDIGGLSGTVNGTLSFELFSLYSQEAINLLSLVNETGSSVVSNCTTSDHQKWSCSGTINITTDGNYTVNGTVTGQDMISPTIWTLKEFSIKVPNTTVCYNVPDQDVGVWRGGVEAIIPFVRVDETAPAYTTIVLTNRSNNDLKVYASLFNNEQRLVVPKIELGVIPAKNTKKFTWTDLKNAFSSNELLSTGTSMKIMILAPTETDYGDAYVKGYVIYDYNGQARYVPIEFNK